MYKRQDFSWNSNNYVHGETARIRSRRETGWECPAGAIDVVAMEDDIRGRGEGAARTADEGGVPEGSGLEGRRRRETAAIAYLAEHEDVDRPVRFDDAVSYTHLDVYKRQTFFLLGIDPSLQGV